MKLMRSKFYSYSFSCKTDLYCKMMSLMCIAWISNFFCSFAEEERFKCLCGFPLLILFWMTNLLWTIAVYPIAFTSISSVYYVKHLGDNCVAWYKLFGHLFLINNWFTELRQILEFIQDFQFIHVCHTCFHFDVLNFDSYINVISVLVPALVSASSSYSLATYKDCYD